jgi:hypothetical protein
MNNHSCGQWRQICKPANLGIPGLAQGPFCPEILDIDPRSVLLLRWITKKMLMSGACQDNHAGVEEKRKNGIQRGGGDVSWHGPGPLQGLGLCWGAADFCFSFRIAARAT